jgi:membrane protein implicated in regulation of membrane protease activity
MIPRLMVVLFVATAVVVAAVIALTLRSWWVLAAVLVLHAIVTILVVAYALRQAGETDDKPDPVSEARIEEERSRSGGERRPHDAPWPPAQAPPGP